MFGLHLLEYVFILVAFVSGGALGVFWPRSRSSQHKSDVLFFPDERMPCYTFYKQLEGVRTYCQRKNCRFAHYGKDRMTSFMAIFEALNAATKRIDLCIYDFTQRNLAEFLVNAANRGIKVRIITDAHPGRRDQNIDTVKRGDEDEISFCSGDQIPQLQKAGIPIKVNRPESNLTSLMHNKFVLVDGKCLMMGSFNWTQNAVLRNHEALIKTYEQRVVFKFMHKFDQMWKQLHYRPR